ncbi:hypothetical protein [Brevundimonas sp. NIBR10]|uniref:hypothetical protein n=1 Tax=Brevundimonas sp. NIBR10 TaxID=3015997 RepID=UPI0022F17B17|nr:hypothetical protein [Brevundimonas sp. NIBR10]
MVSYTRNASPADADLADAVSLWYYVGRKGLHAYANDDWRRNSVNVGVIVENRWSAFGHCTVCDLRIWADLHRIIQAKGRHYSLWGANAACRLSGQGSVGDSASRRDDRHCHDGKGRAVGREHLARIGDLFGMTKPSKPSVADPLAPEAVDGYVEAVDPPESKLKLTPDAAEISAIRLLDAAAKARE